VARTSVATGLEIEKNIPPRGMVSAPSCELKTCTLATCSSWRCAWQVPARRVTPAVGALTMLRDANSRQGE